MKLSDEFREWLRKAYRQPTTHYTEANMEVAFHAGAEAAVQAEREGAEQFGWYFMDDPKVYTMPGSGFRVGPDRPADTLHASPLYLHPPQASASDGDQGSHRQAVPEDALQILDNVLADMKDGFVRCDTCGDQKDTKDIDAFSELKRLRSVLAASQQDADKAQESTS